MILACFFFIASVSAIIFAYRYLNPPPTFTDTISRYPVPLGGEPSSTPGPEDSSAIRVLPQDAPSSITAPANTRNTARSKSDARSVQQVNTQPYTDRPAYVVPLSPNSPASTPSNAIVTVPPSTMMAYAISAPRPAYPTHRYSDSDSTVDVETTISRDGRVTSARALTGTFDVRNAAVQAVKAWRFKPFVFNGDPVTVVTTFEFVFKGK